MKKIQFKIGQNGGRQVCVLCKGRPGDLIAVVSWLTEYFRPESVPNRNSRASCPPPKFTNVRTIRYLFFFFFFFKL